MTFTAAAHQRNRLLVRIHCWMTTCTNASQCYFGTMNFPHNENKTLWPEDESVIKLWNICNKRMIENFLLFFLQSCPVTLPLSVCNFWKADFRRPITCQHSWQMSGRSLSLWPVVEIEKTGSGKDLLSLHGRVRYRPLLHKPSVCLINIPGQETLSLFKSVCWYWW